MIDINWRKRATEWPKLRYWAAYIMNIAWRRTRRNAALFRNTGVVDCNPHVTGGSARDVGDGLPCLVAQRLPAVRGTLIRVLDA